MSKIKYDLEAESLSRIIDIAIDSIRQNPSGQFEQHHIELFIDVYQDYKNKVENPAPEFHNLTSLKYVRNDILTYFQEGSGDAVEAFWKEIKNKKIRVVRVNRFEKIIKRGKIKNQIEYDIIIDLYNSYIENNMLSVMEIDKINDLISDFEKK